MPLVLAPFLVPFLAFLAAIVLVGLSQASSSQHGSEASGSFFDFITGKTYLHTVSGFASKFARWIVSHFAAGQLRMLARWFSGMGTLTGGLFFAYPQAMEALVHAIERVMHRGDPRARAKATTANTRAIHAGHAAAHANTHARSVGHALDRYKALTAPQIRHATHAVDVTLPRSIGRVRTREEELSRDLGKVRERTRELEHGATRTWEWIRTHPLSGTTALFTGAVAIALSRLGYGFLHCRSWQRLGRSLTCNDANILGDLLAAATLVVGAMSLVELAREEQKVIGEGAKIVRGFWEL